ncbi:hypothetical protein BHF69_05160 [Anaerostipes sp. 992a]|nr:hypothetical protein BHF69_05160 [Anaerostipes sp. 992a]
MSTGLNITKYRYITGCLRQKLEASCFLVLRKKMISCRIRVNDDRIFYRRMDLKWRGSGEDGE